jgi:hypothetical protein
VIVEVDELGVSGAIAGNGIKGSKSGAHGLVPINEYENLENKSSKDYLDQMI